MDRYNSLEANIHKYLVRSLGSFMLVIYAWCEEYCEN